MVKPTTHDSETLAEGQQVITACAFIHHNFDGIEKVFLPKRAASKKFLPGAFELPGGHIDFDEDIVAGLQREIQEEFGMRITVGDPFGCFTYRNDVKRSHSVEVVFFAQFIDPIEQIRLDPDDHSEFLWITAEELPKVLSAQKNADDPEFVVLQKGFKLLGGARLTM